MTSLLTIVMTLAVSGALVAYVLYGVIRVPRDLDQQDQLITTFAQARFIRGLSYAAAYFGIGHPTTNFIYISEMLSPITNQPSYPGLKVWNATLDGVSVRIYEPESRTEGGPAIVFIHGGGWVRGSIDEYEPITSSYAIRLSVLVISVGYRLAPDHPFPVPADECERVISHLMDNAAKYHVDPKRISVVGLSAGANLAAAMAWKFRETERPLANQVLIVPCLQAIDFRTPSYQANENDAILPRYAMVDFWLWYALGHTGHQYRDTLIANSHTSADAKRTLTRKHVDHDLISRRHVDQSYKPNDDNYGNETLWAELREVFTNPFFAPLMADDLSGLPRTLIMTSEFDVLRDDGMIYARRLSKAGVNVIHDHYDGSFHGSMMHFQTLKLPKKMFEDTINYLSSNL